MTVAGDKQNPFDYIEIMLRWDSDEQFIIKLLKLFKQDFSEIYPRILRAFEEGDVNSLSMEVHTLKGAASSVCAVRVKQALLDIEQVIKLGKMRDVTYIITSLPDIYQEFANEVKVNQLMMD